ncbi:MAG: ATP-binding protein [Xenococcaceae cyanobacterium]
MKASPAQFNSICWQDLGAELVFTQDYSGKYLSFYWQDAQDYGLSNEQVLGSSPEQILTPVAPEAYFERIRRVIERRIPEQCHWQFEYRGQSFPFELVITPILPRNGQAKSVLVMGHLLSEAEMPLTTNSALPANPDPYQKLLTNIARKIRSTLDLEKIWMQTVDSLGEALQVSRCLIVSYNPEKEQLDVKAEYCQKPCKSMLGRRLDWQSEPYLKQAISFREPVVVDQIVPDIFKQKSALLVSTFYHNQRNGLICLMQCDRRRHWSQAEMELVQELADQVGTAIAHATLYQELKRARIEAEEASCLKSEFLASTSHELRTPLNGIIGFLKLILDGMADNPEEEREFIEEAYNSAIHLLNLINDILDIAKIEAGKMELDFTAVELDELFLNLEKKTRPQAQQKNLSFKLKIPATLTPVILYGNYQRLLQVMLNLVGNAIKFTHEGGIIISAEIVKKKVKRHNQEFPGMVKISVADTGIGVSLEKQDKLFEKFVQVDGFLTKAYGGTGLGLAISQMLVEAMGGKIFFFSMGEGLGSTVTFTIPLNNMPVMKTVHLGSDSIELAS